MIRIIVMLQFLVATAGCHQQPLQTRLSSSSDEIVGLVESGFEARGFRFCDTSFDGGVWRPFELPSGVDASRWPGTPIGMSAAMGVIRLRGGLSPIVPGGTGRARALIVRKVISVRAAKRADCGWTED